MVSVSLVGELVSAMVKVGSDGEKLCVSGRSQSKQHEPS